MHNISWLEQCCRRSLLLLARVQPRQILLTKCNIKENDPALCVVTEVPRLMLPGLRLVLI